MIIASALVSERPWLLRQWLMIIQWYEQYFDYFKIIFYHKRTCFVFFPLFYGEIKTWNEFELCYLSFYLADTVVWNDYLLIFSQKCHILFHKKVGNSLQIIKYINLSRFQHILKL